MIRHPPRSPLFPYPALSRSASIGLAEYPEGGDTPEELIGTADAAMYQAKSAGRNQVVVAGRSEEHTSNSSHSQISYAVFCLKKKQTITAWRLTGWITSSTPT